MIRHRLELISRIHLFGRRLALLSILLGVFACDTKDNPIKRISGIGSEDRDRGGSGSTPPGDSIGDQGGDDSKFIDTPLVERFMQLVADISARSSQLNRERDRRGKLRLALGTKLGSGCMQDVVVKTIEVEIDGSKMGDIEVSSQFKGLESPPTHTGKSVFEFSFGDSTFSSVLTFSNDELSNSLFSVGTKKSWIPAQRDFTIGQIQRLKIKKLTADYEVRDLCEGGSTFSACKNVKKISELNRYYLSGLKIRVNGELIYERGNIGHAFANHLNAKETAKSYSLGFSDDHLNLNEGYVKMKQRDDCSALQ